jgi:hypothetical protein
MTSALSSLTSSVLTSTAFSPMGLAVGPAGRQPNPPAQQPLLTSFAVSCKAPARRLG